MWNLQHDDESNVVAKVTAHEEGLTQLSWISDVIDARTLLLVSSSLDGYLNFWNFSYTSAVLSLKQRYNSKFSEINFNINSVLDV